MTPPESLYPPEHVRPFNPLAKTNLGISVADALLQNDPYPLPPPEPFRGAGIYAIYYRGNFPLYRPLTQLNQAAPEYPIYVGKAVPPGARKGGFGLGEDPGQVLYGRLIEHSQSILATNTLTLDDFVCRFLVVDDIWIPLGEALLIERFQPLWNRELDGFGNHDPGSKRYTGKKPTWDVIHPGRTWADKCAPNARSADEIRARITRFFQQMQPAKQ
jgi:hypothetical protein